ncbi:hypothetical protein HMF8227_02551 [Saliniradius amylolyticus]|uniref:Uncharacterized protein n=1 Tax=Saliniradius amylolyticus TaxID=2183582 RepID=A0A2S2E5U1_9ALTE|nr:hypothetical protein [Saliniradius amylolyticus]AWL13003.1 hypothetical protein HMF8227_02551 [Saliniradius amylolyticus]
MLKRLLILVYALGGYLVGVLSLIYLMGFIINVAVPKGINDGEPGNVWISLFVNAALISLFGLHHSLTARTKFKHWLKRYHPVPVQRATYLYFTALMTAVLVIFWQPIDIIIWQVNHPEVVTLILGLYFFFWALMVMSSFPIGHFHLLGLAQAWNHFLKKQSMDPPFSTKFLYGVVRHPISSCWVLIAWCTPVMTLGHLVFAVGVLVYILLATPHEEKDLVQDIGPDYLKYKEEVPPFIPLIFSSNKQLRKGKNG